METYLAGGKRQTPRYDDVYAEYSFQVDGDTIIAREYLGEQSSSIVPTRVFMIDGDGLKELDEGEAMLKIQAVHSDFFHKTREDVERRHALAAQGARAVTS